MQEDVPHSLPHVRLKPRRKGSRSFSTDETWPRMSTSVSSGRTASGKAESAGPMTGCLDEATEAKGTRSMPIMTMPEEIKI